MNIRKGFCPRYSIASSPLLFSQFSYTYSFRSNACPARRSRPLGFLSRTILFSLASLYAYRTFSSLTSPFRPSNVIELS